MGKHVKRILVGSGVCLIPLLILFFQNCGGPSQSVNSSSLTAPSDATSSNDGGTGTNPASADLLVAPFTPTRTLKVCPSGCSYSLPSAAVAAAKDGDLIEIEAASYNDCATISTNKLWIRGINGRPNIHTKICGSKGIFVTTGADITIDNIEFSDIYISEALGNNAAGIRGEGQKLTVRNCYFHDGQDGILGGAALSTGRVLIQYSHFARLGYSGYEHDMYIGPIAEFTIENSVVEEGYLGNIVKTRASKSTIRCNKIMGGYNSDYSKDGYDINLPNGGDVLIENNLIAQGQYTNNKSLSDYGSEGLASGVTHRLQINNNIFINDFGSGVFVNMFQAPASGAQMIQNILIGGGTVAGGSAASSLTQVNNKTYSNRASAGITEQFPLPSACTKPVGNL